MNLFKIVPLIKTVCKVTTSLMGVNRQQDVEVFHRLDAILDEPRLAKMLNYSLFTERLTSEDRNLLYKFVEALLSGENQYLHPVIELRSRKLASEMSQLLGTVGATFSSDDGETFHFRPDQQDPAAYSRQLDTLHERIEQAWKAYKIYRQGIKDRLNV